MKKKYLFEVILALLIIIEIILITFNYVDKCEIAKLLEIDNINDFSVQELKESLGYDSANPIFIKFKISVDKYEKYNLKYEDVSIDDYIYEGEITNKKHKISDDYYMCYYEKVIYSKEEKAQFRKIKNNKLFFIINSIILSILIFVYATKKIIVLVKKHKYI